MCLFGLRRMLKRTEKYLGYGAYPLGAMFVPSALEDAVQGILAILYSDFRLDTKSRDELIRKRHNAGESQSALAREFGVSPQRVHQIIHGSRMV